MARELRAFERAVVGLSESGLGDQEIAWRFRRSPGHIRRVRELVSLSHREADLGASEELRPVERRVLRSREEGASPTEIAARFRRSPQWVERVESLAQLKLAQ